MTHRQTITTVVCLVSTVPVLACEPRQPAAPDAVLQLEPYFRDLRVVRLATGADTLTMLFDTGGGNTLIVPELAARIGCNPFGADVGHRMSGEQVVFQRCDSLTLSVPGWTRRLAPVAVFDVNALLPEVLPRVDGVLALDAFAGEMISIDLPGDRVTIAGSAGADTLARNALPVRFATGKHGGSLVAMVRIEARRGALWFLLDSGNLVGTRVAEWVEADSLLPRPEEGAVRMQIDGSGAVTLPYTVADLVIDGALGTDFFRRGPVVLDLRAADPEGLALF